MKHKVDEWRMEVEKLAEVAGSQPQAAYMQRLCMAQRTNGTTCVEQ